MGATTRIMYTYVYIITAAIGRYYITNITTNTLLRPTTLLYSLVTRQMKMTRNFNTLVNISLYAVNSWTQTLECVSNDFSIIGPLIIMHTRLAENGWHTEMLYWKSAAVYSQKMFN